MDTFNWRHHLFYRSCSRAVTHRLRTLSLFLYCPFFCLARSIPRAERVQDLTVVCSETQHSSFSLSSWDHFLKVTAHTCIQTQATHSNKRSIWPPMGGLREEPDKCSLSLTHTHTDNATINVYACDSQVNKVTCLYTLPENVFLRTSQVYHCLVTHFHRLHQSCTHIGMYL